MRQDLELGGAIKESASRVGLPDTRPYTLGILLVHGIGECSPPISNASRASVTWVRAFNSNLDYRGTSTNLP